MKDYDVNVSKFIRLARKTEFDFGLVNSVYTKEIDYKEDVTGVTLATERVLVLDEE